MELKARLVHADAGARVVEVSAWSEGHCLGRTLGEASNAEAAEDRALERLQRRLGRPARAASPAPPAPLPAPVAAIAEDSIEPERPTPALTRSSEPSEPPADPDDWSDALAELDLELRRIGWGREQEEAYLQRAFGHHSRSRLTAFKDLNTYLKAVKLLQPGTDPHSAAVPLQRSALLSQSDLLLQQLGWDASRGRGFLEHHFQLASRQQLNDEQLLRFNLLLEGELIAAPQG